ncbi:MAG TPA: gas vesicle protein GvpO [Actinocatenispora sp.]
MATRERDTDDRGTAQRRPRVSAAGASKAAVKHLTGLTGRDIVGVVSVRRGEESGWTVGVEVVEDRHVPSSADILATYEVELDDRGDLRSYQRARRYTRGSTGGGGQT